MKMSSRLRLAAKVLLGKRSDFKATAVNRLLMDWVASTKAADEEIRGDIRKLRARARELARNEPSCRHFLRILECNVIGPKGASLQAQIRGTDGALDREQNAELEQAWRRWARGPVTLDGRLNLRQFQAVCLRALARDGEIFIRKFVGTERNPFGLALQAIDADLVEEGNNRFADRLSNEIRMGIEIDKYGAPVAYWIQGDPTKLYTDSAGTRIRIPAQDIIHLYIPDRPNQTRGVSWLASGMATLHVLAGYEEAELYAARTAAAKMGFFQKPETTGELPPTTTPHEIEASPGSIDELPPGWTFAGWDPTHPTTAFGAFVKWMLRKVGSGFGIDYNSLGNDLEGVTYSSLRAGAIQQQDLWRSIQEEWGDLFLWPVYRAWIDTAILSREVDLPRLDFRLYVDAVVWRFRGWAWVDPLKEIQAVEKAISLGMTSRTREAASRGDEFEEVLEELARETELAQELGVSIVPVTGTPAAPDSEGQGMMTPESDAEQPEDPADAGGSRSLRLTT